MLLATKQVTNLVCVAAVNKWGHLSALYSCFSIILLLFSHFFSCKLGFIKTLTLPVMEPEIDSAGVSSNKVWWVLVLFTGAPWVFMCACPGVALILIDFLLGCWMHRWTFSKDFCPSNALFQHQRSLSVKDQRTWNMKACPMTHPGLFGCVNLSTAGLSLMVIPDWPFFFFFFAEGGAQKWIQTLEIWRKTTDAFENPTFASEVSLSGVLGAVGPSEDSPQRAADDIVLCGLHLLVW